MLAISAVPGPSDFLVIARAMTLGFAQAIVVTAGIIGADFVLIAIAMYALNTVAGMLGPWFVAVEVASGLLLLALAALTWRAHRIAGDRRQSISSASNAGSFAAGFSITLGDSKALLFYFGLLPPFIDSAQVRWRDAITLMLAAMLAITIVKLSYAAMAARASGLVESPRARRSLTAIAASVLALTGLVLLARAAT